MSGDRGSATRPPSAEAQQRPARAFVLKSAAGTAADDTRYLLQARLRMATIALMAVLTTFFVRSFFVDGATLRGDVGAALIVVLVVALVALTRNGDLSIPRLRLIELAVFGAPALRIAFDSYTRILEMARAGSGAMVLAEMQSTTLAFFAVITFYGMFIPNTVKRASLIIGSYGVVFILLLPVMSFHDPRAWTFIWQVVDIEQRSGMVIMMLFAVGISITASSIIHTLRSEVLEARQLGQYRLTELIGRGGMGEVWKAEHALLARPAAVKLIRPEALDPSDPAKAESMIRRFEREAQTTASLRSVHTVELYDFGITEGGTFYFVMELLDGIDLETLVARHGPLPPARVRYLARQVCDSLQEAHEMGLVHRDIKPANVVVCRLGGEHDFVKVLDFGLAKHHEAQQGDVETAKLTREGTIIGTPAYMPPETVTRGVADARSDIYALGCVMFWTLTGQIVFEGAQGMSMVVRHVRDTPEPPSKRSPRIIPRGLDRVVLACLEKDPETRPQNAAEIKRMLDECELEDDWGEADAERWWAARDG